MDPITLVTGNPHKLAELQAVFPTSLKLKSQKLDLDEIQSLDLHEIVSHKLHQAYQLIKAPVIVEDVSAELEKLNGLPGPFIKFFEQQLGRGALHTLAGEGRIRVVCAMGYYDGKTEHIVDGILDGTVVAPRAGEGFGFDFVLVPDGYNQTLSELGTDVKNSISHRYNAAQLMSSFLATPTA
ncbi:MAG TPA: non-canonical purine NTP pyrophosphatase [Candidatus Limnocylindrales bacterium]|nr:non-canonical purine NTP pyrophosphatase [Candidatus Limnocylindrales bacterium]